MDFKHAALIIKIKVLRKRLQIYIRYIMIRGTWWRSWLRHCAGVIRLYTNRLNPLNTELNHICQ